jgi:transposase
MGPRTNLIRFELKRGYLTDVLTRIVNGHPNSDIDQLVPWAYRKQDLRAVA